MMKIAITGAAGFLGWHTFSRLRALGESEVLRLGRLAFADVEGLAGNLREVDAVIHLAGVNRAEDPADVETGNVEIATTLAAAVNRSGRPITLVNGNSIQAEMNNPYGRGKARASDLIHEAVNAIGGVFVDLQLPNLFGEHGRPHYNSFIATFCDQLARGEYPTVSADKALRLLHAQDAAGMLIDAATGVRDELSEIGESHTVMEVLERLQAIHSHYSDGEIPPLNDKFTTDLFNTYRSYTFPRQFPFSVVSHADERGSLVETVRAHGGSGQSFVSFTRPGHTRGEHFHLHKFERFFVLRGEAEIALRRLGTTEVLKFRVTGGDHAFVDMPTMWVHNITNVGADELVTMFWTDQLMDPTAPDTFWERVELANAQHQEQTA